MGRRMEGHGAMNQKTLVAGLVLLMLAALGGGLLVMGRNGPLAGWFASGDTSRPRNVQATKSSPEEVPSADAFATDRVADGRDESGPYRWTRDGRKVYVDERGFPVSRAPGNAGASGGAKGRNAERGSGGAPAHVSGGSNGTDKAQQEEPGALAFLTGRVVNDLGEPLLATVSVTFAGGSEMPQRVTTQDDGRFSVGGLPLQVSLTVIAQDSRGNSSRPMTTRLADGTVNLGDIVILRDTGIRGTVLSAESGAPVAEAQVFLQEFNGLNFRDVSSLRTSQGGGFEFVPLLPGSYRLRVSREGYAPRILNNVSPPADLRVELSPGVGIAGRVVDAADVPVAGAQVHCDFFAEPNQHFHTEASTDVHGEFLVRCQPESLHNVITVLAPGFSRLTQNFVKSGTSDLEIRLQRSSLAVVRGRILTPQLQPVSSAMLSVFRTDGRAARMEQRTGPDAEGRFWCEVALDAAQLAIAAPGYPSRRVDIAPVAGEVQDLGDVMLQAGVNVFGLVYEQGEPRRPVQDARISAENRQAVSDASGQYRLEGLPVASFLVGVQHPAFLGNTLRVTPAQGQYEIELDIELRKADFSARVRVTDAADGEPLAGVSVSVVDYGQTLTTDETGSVRINGLSSLRPRCRFSKAGYVETTLEVTAYPSAEVDQKPAHEVSLVRGSGIRGLCSSQGKALPGGVVLEVWYLDGKGKLSQPAGNASATTDSQGRYATGNLPPGQYFVGISAYRVAARPVTVPAEGGASLDFELGSLCSLRGVMKRHDGTPHANAGVYVHHKAHVYYIDTVYTGPGGEFEVSNLWPDTFTLTPLKTQGDSSAQFTVDVTLETPGLTQRVLTLPRATGVVEGRVTYPDGAPVVGARVSITNLDAGWERACLAAYVVTDAQGHYRAERMENGVRMLARVGGYPDEAETSTAFSDPVVVPQNSEPVQADIVVERRGVTVVGVVRRQDGGPLPGGSGLYLVDAQGRLSGLYFGGQGAQGSFTLHDVAPGTYRLMAANPLLKRGEITLEVGTGNLSGIEILVEPHR